MRSARARRGRFWTTGIVLVFVATALLLNVPSFAAASAPSAAVSRSAAADGYTVTWNSADVTTASSVSSALSIDFTQSATVWFNWTVTTPVTISMVQLQMFYFGFAVTTRTVTASAPMANLTGHIPLTWTPLSLAFVLEGIYKITASFIAVNSTTLFSENFYVRANALYGFVAAIPIVLLILMIYEVYALMRSGRYAMLGRKPETPPPSTPSTDTGEGAPSEGGAPSSAPGEPPSSTPPPEETPPASGGSS